MKVLIIDSERTDTLDTCLRELGCNDVRVATSYDEGLCCARDRAAGLDLVVIALDLDDGDGLATCRRLSALQIGVPIIACCKEADEGTLRAAFEAGASDVIAKPFRFGEVAARVRAALRLREERQRRDQQLHRLLQWTRQLERSKADLESTVCVDALTGIGNRRHFDTLIQAEWRRAMRDGTELSLVIFDLDEFHAFNDRYGHVGGDACLARVAKALAHGLRRASDVLARYGGEEFVAVLPDTSPLGACIVAERLRARVEELAIAHAASTCGAVVTLSAGIASCRPATGITPEVLVAAADAALFRAKHDGRNCCRADGIEAERIVVTRRPWPKCPVVVVDPVLVQRVPRFLESARAQLEPARHAVDSRDWSRAAGVAFQLARTATSLGFDELAALGSRFEASARAGGGDDALAVLAELSWHVEHVQVVYRRSHLRAV